MLDTVFYILAFAAVLGAAMCVLQRSPVASAMWLMSTMFSLACIYVLLNAELIGVLQVLVYVGAILVLFLFVLMLLNLGKSDRDMRGPSSLAATVVIVGLLLAELASIWRYDPRRLAVEVTGAAQADPTMVFAGARATDAAIQSHGVVGGLAAPLFQQYLVPFEITSILLLTALVGAVVLAKRRI